MATGRNVCALALLVAVALLAGCKRDHRSPSETIRDGMGATRRAVQEVVADASRREQLFVHVDEFERLLIAQNAEVDETSSKLRVLNADPAAERAAFAQVLEEAEARWRARRARLIDVHFAMIALTTPEEWEVIVEREEKALASLSKLQEKG